MTRPGRLAALLLATAAVAGGLSSAAQAAKVPTKVTTDAAVLDLVPKLGLSLAPQGKLLRADNGKPVPGKTVRIILGSSPGTVLCTSQTLANGSFRCGGSLPNMLAVGLNLGYYAQFPGDATHAPSGARGPIVRLLGLGIIGG